MIIIIATVLGGLTDGGRFCFNYTRRIVYTKNNRVYRRNGIRPKKKKRKASSSGVGAKTGRLGKRKRPNSGYGNEQQ